MLNSAASDTVYQCPIYGMLGINGLRGIDTLSGKTTLSKMSFSFCFEKSQKLSSALVAQLDAPTDWRPGGHGFNPSRGRQHSFVEIDRVIFSMVILSLPLIQEGQ